MTHYSLFGWGSPVEHERRRRIMLSVAAYAYEVENAPIMTDAEFDKLAKASNPAITTGRLDEWWRENFRPHTGQWIHDHPEIDGIIRYYRLTIGRNGAQHNASSIAQQGCEHVQN